MTGARKLRPRELKSPPVERREAPLRDRKRRGDASQASRAAAPAAQEVSHTSAFHGAPLPSAFTGGRDGKAGRPGPLNNRGDVPRPFGAAVLCDNPLSARSDTVNCPQHRAERGYFADETAHFC